MASNSDPLSADGPVAPVQPVEPLGVPLAVGSDTPAAPVRRRSVAAIVLYGAIVAAAWVALELYGLGVTPFHTKGEPREALVVWEMTHHGGWILPRRNGTELPSKPPLFHWLGALTSLAQGQTDEWSIRFPSVAFSLAALLCVFAAGCALWNPRAGLLSALTLMTTFEWARAATNARVDMTLTFGLTLAFLSLLFFLQRRQPRWLVPMYLGITLAVLDKGPVGVALPGLVALAMVALAWDIAPLRRMRLLRGTIAVGIGAGTWYALALAIGGYAFFRKQILGENLFTFIDDPDFHYGGHRHPASYMVGALLLGLLPWTLCLPGVVARLWRERRTLARDDARIYLLVWIAIVFVFYSIAASKRSVYLLGLYPALALLLGWWWDETIRAPQAESAWTSRLLGFLGWAVLGPLVALVGMVVLEALGAPIAATIAQWLPADAQPYCPVISATIRADRWHLLLLLIAAAGALYATTRMARARQWLTAFVSLWSATALLVAAVQFIIMAGLAESLTARDFMADVRRVVGPEGQLSFYRTFDYGAVYYWRGHIAEFTGSWPADAPQYLLVRKADWPELRETAHDEFEAVSMPADNYALGELALIRRRAAP